MATDFSSIPIRANDQRIDASFFNSLRSELVNLETAPSLKQYASDAAYVTAKTTAADDGDYYYNTTTDEVRVYVNGAWTGLVDLGSAQTLTLKSIDADNNTITNLEVDNLKAGVLDTDISAVSGADDTLASAKAIKTYVDAGDHTQNTDTGTNANTFTVGDNADTDKKIEADTGAANNPALRYNTTDDAWEFSNDGTTYSAMGSGTGGAGGAGFNYNDNDFNTDIATVSTTDAVNLAISQETTSPLLEAGSLKIVKAASDQSNDYVTLKTFTIEDIHDVTPCEVEFGYSITNDSGTYTTGDVEVRIYDNTNSAYISVVPGQLEASGVAAKFFGEFQTQSGATSYDVRLFVANTNTNGFTMLVDGFGSGSWYVGPSRAGIVHSINAEYVKFDGHAGYGSTATKIPYYTNERSNLSGSIVTVANDSTNGFSITAIKDCVINGSFWSDKNIIAQLDIGWSVDATTTTNFTSLTEDLVVGQARDRATSNATGLTTAPVNIKLSAGQVLRPHTDAHTIVAAADSGIVFTATEIVSSNVIDSGRRERIEYKGNAGETITTASVTPIPFGTKVDDTHGAWDGNTFTAQTSGSFTFLGSIRYTVATTSQTHLYIDEGGGYSKRYNLDGADVNANTSFKDFRVSTYLNAGDKAQIRNDENGLVLNNDSASHWISVTKDQAPNQLAASEKVIVEAYDTSGQSIGTQGDMSFNTTVTNTHGSSVWDGTTFTAPRAGYLSLYSGLLMNAVAMTAGQNISMYILKNGSTVKQHSVQVQASVTFNWPVQIAYEGLKLDKGDTVKIQHSSPTSSTLFAGATYNRIGITFI